MEFKLSSGRTFSVYPLTPEQARTIVEANHSAVTTGAEAPEAELAELIALAMVRAVTVGYALRNASQDHEAAINTLHQMKGDEINELHLHVCKLTEFAAGSGSRFIN